MINFGWMDYSMAYLFLNIIFGSPSFIDELIIKNIDFVTASAASYVMGRHIIFYYIRWVIFGSFPMDVSYWWVGESSLFKLFDDRKKWKLVRGIVK